MDVDDTVYLLPTYTRFPENTSWHFQSILLFGINEKTTYDTYEANFDGLVFINKIQKGWYITFIKSYTSKTSIKCYLFETSLLSFLLKMIEDSYGEQTARYVNRGSDNVIFLWLSSLFIFIS